MGSVVVHQVVAVLQEDGDILEYIMTESIIGFLVQMITTLIVYGACTIIIAFTLWMIVDAAKQDRFWWVVVIWGVPGIGPAVYYLTEKKHEYAKAPSHHIHESETEAQHETTHEPHKAHEHHRKEDIVVEVTDEDAKAHKGDLEEVHTVKVKEEK